MSTAIFGGIVKIVERKDSIFEIENNQIDASEQISKSFVGFIKNEISFFGLNQKPLNLREFSKLIWLMKKKAGFVFIEVVETVVRGVAATSVFVHHPLTTLFLLTGKSEPKMIGVSPVWTYEYIQRKPPRLVPLYPRKVKQGSTTSTMMLVSSDERSWYGLPDSVSTMFHQYAEFQQAEYVTKQTHNKFMGEVFIEVEDANPDTYSSPTQDVSPVKELRDKLNEEHTNRGLQPSSMVVSTRPFGAKQAFVFQFEPNNNSDWYLNMAEWSRDYIISANGWSKRMMGINESSGLSTNTFIDEFKIKDVLTIQPEQSCIDRIINTIIEDAAKLRNITEFEDYSIKFSSPFQKLLEDAQNADTTDPGD